MPAVPIQLPRRMIVGPPGGGNCLTASIRRGPVAVDGPPECFDRLSPIAETGAEGKQTKPDERDAGQEIAGNPTIARNSSVVFVTGNGSLGTSRPSRSQMGSHPSAGDHSSRRSPGTFCRTASLCRS
jgi:hypothetical protein